MAAARLLAVRNTTSALASFSFWIAAWCWAQVWLPSGHGSSAAPTTFAPAFFSDGSRAFSIASRLSVETPPGCWLMMPTRSPFFRAPASTMSSGHALYTRFIRIDVPEQHEKIRPSPSL